MITRDELIILKMAYKVAKQNFSVALSKRAPLSTRPMTRRWQIAMQRALPRQTWIRRLGLTRWEGQVYGFGDSLDTTPVLPSYASSVAPPAYASSFAAPPSSGGEDMRTLIQEELQT
ncbi:hypothetical protein Taro_020013 [Colocasia esculenta]|uniref:Uncharacterized protein n=1 Tax=Colocasia esculenta TaxID=4460 RepID=A0A843V0V0_COLES|nr:hypothetical protein [Colocasia esculenta]